MFNFLFNSQKKDELNAKMLINIKFTIDKINCILNEIHKMKPNETINDKAVEILKMLISSKLFEFLKILENIKTSEDYNGFFVRDEFMFNPYINAIKEHIIDKLI